MGCRGAARPPARASSLVAALACCALLCAAPAGAQPSSDAHDGLRSGALINDSSASAVVSSEAEFHQALTNQALTHILVNGTAGPLVLTQAFWAAVTSPIPIARSLTIEPTPDSPPAPIFDFAYVSGKAKIVGCAAPTPSPLPPSNTTTPTAPASATSTPATAAPATPPGAATPGTPPTRGAPGSGGPPSGGPAGGASAVLGPRLPNATMVTVSGFELRHIQVRVSFGFFISPEHCELRVQDSINHLEVAMPQSFGERYWTSTPRPGPYAAAGWPQQFAYVPSLCYPHNRSLCFSPATVLRDVALVDPLTDTNGGYLLHYMNTYSHGDTNLEEACVKVMSMPDCVQRAIAKLRGLPVPELGMLAGGGNVTGPAVPAAAAAAPDSGRKGVNPLAWILPLAIGVPVVLLALLLLRYSYLLAHSEWASGEAEGHAEGGGGSEDGEATTTNSSARRRTRRLLSLLGSMASSLWGTAGGSSAAGRGPLLDSMLPHHTAAGCSGTAYGTGTNAAAAHAAGFTALLHGPAGIALGQLLGQGSFGRVFEGWWRGGRVAVKVIPHGSGAEADKVAREAHVSTTLDHPNVVRTLAVATTAPQASTVSSSPLRASPSPTPAISARSAPGRDPPAAQSAAAAAASPAAPAAPTAAHTPASAARSGGSAASAAALNTGTASLNTSPSSHAPTSSRKDSHSAASAPSPSDNAAGGSPCGSTPQQPGKRGHVAGLFRNLFGGAAGALPPAAPTPVAAAAPAVIQIHAVASATMPPAPAFPPALAAAEPAPSALPPTTTTSTSGSAASRTPFASSFVAATAAAALAAGSGPAGARAACARAPHAGAQQEVSPAKSTSSERIEHSEARDAFAAVPLVTFASGGPACQRRAAEAAPAAAGIFSPRRSAPHSALAEGALPPPLALPPRSPMIVPSPPAGGAGHPGTPRPAASCSANSQAFDLSPMPSAHAAYNVVPTPRRLGSAAAQQHPLADHGEQQEEQEVRQQQDGAAVRTLRANAAAGPPPAAAAPKRSLFPVGGVPPRAPPQPADQTETWMVQELCEGGSLAAAIARGDFHHPDMRELRVDAVLSVAKDIARGMSYLHGKGIVHGDLKADNVLLSKRPPTAKPASAKARFVRGKAPASAPVSAKLAPSTGSTPSDTTSADGTGAGARPYAASLPAPAGATPTSAPGSTSATPNTATTASGSSAVGPEAYAYVAKVGDFGMARLLDPGATALRTCALGTVSHLAPELLLRGEMRREGDVYAFGVMLFELCMGAKAYSGLSHGEVVKRVILHGMRPDAYLEQQQQQQASAPSASPTPAPAGPAPPSAAWPEQLAELAASCWSGSVAERPSFDEVLYRLHCMGMGMVAVLLPHEQEEQQQEQPGSSSEQREPSAAAPPVGVQSLSGGANIAARSPPPGAAGVGPALGMPGLAAALAAAAQHAADPACTHASTSNTRDTNIPSHAGHSVAATFSGASLVPPPPAGGGGLAALMSHMARLAKPGSSSQKLGKQAAALAAAGRSVPLPALEAARRAAAAHAAAEEAEAAETAAGERSGGGLVVVPVFGASSASASGSPRGPAAATAAAGEDRDGVLLEVQTVEGELSQQRGPAPQGHVVLEFGQWGRV